MKPRVHELARDCSTSSEVVLARLRKMGEFVKSASSTVEPSVARRLRRELMRSTLPAQRGPNNHLHSLHPGPRHLRDASAADAASGPESSIVVVQPSEAPEPASGQLVEPDDGGREPDLSYLHCPFLNPGDYLTARTWLLPDQLISRRAPALPRPSRARLSAEDQVALSSWTQRGFSIIERDVWLAHGLGRHDAHLAEHCRRLMIEPAMLHLLVDGRRVAERLRGGESPTSVLARFQAGA